MCSRYNPPRWDSFHAEFRAMPPERLPVGPIFPRQHGVFVRGREEQEREAVVAQFGLIPSFAKALPLRYATHNARFETVPGGAAFRDAWRRGQRCIVPLQSFFEPCWETGRNVWWNFRAPHGRDFGVAGLWNAWTDRESGEVIESYTMLTVNADAHPLMRRMHKPDPKLGPDGQDKRSVVLLDPADWDTWLRGPVDAAKALVRLPDDDALEGEPEDDGRMPTLF
jgi:putative SOS response-associated peptidase YedK